MGLEPAGCKPHDYNDIVYATPVGGGSRICEPSYAPDPLQGSVNWIVVAYLGFPPLGLQPKAKVLKTRAAGQLRKVLHCILGLKALTLRRPTARVVQP